MALPVVIREQIFIPVNRVDEQSIIDRYTRKLYDDKACSNCDNLQDRHSDICDSCKSYEGEYRLYSHKLFGGRQFIGLPVGDKALLPKITGYSFDEMKIYDKRTKAPFRHEIRLTCAPRPYQAKVIADFLRKKYGLIESPPRSGKTYMALNIGLQLGQRILFLADQHEFLTQFLDHVYGNEKEGIPRCTNVDELEEKLGYKIAGIPKKLEDFENFEIMAMTYQSFLSEVKGKKLLSLINKHVGLVCIDEVHATGARRYSEVVQKLRAMYRMGVSGTIERKDCFVADTQISTPAGLRSIQELRVGDFVWSYNEQANAVEAKKVVETHKRANSQLVRVTYSGGSVVCTPDEEFYCVNRKAYIKARNLTPNDVLRIDEFPHTLD